MTDPAPLAPAPAGPPRPSGRGFGVRLLFAQAAVLAVGGASTWVVAVIVGPPLFREHLHRAGVPHGSDQQLHAEEAYRYATAISIAVALAVSGLTALVVTAYVSRRIQRSLTAVSSAATALAEGRYGIRVQPPQLGAEFAALAHAFNQMANRLESVDATRRQLFGDLAHEIRTPVAVLEAYLEAVEDGVRELDGDTIAMLRHQTRRLVRFSEDFNALAQAEEGQVAISPQWVDPTALLTATLAAADDRYAAKQVALRLHAPAPLPEVWLDPQRFAQVLGNLIDNALRHTPAHGHVTVTAAVDRGALTVSVSDDGEGIPPQHLPYLFERFYRADTARDRKHGGAGVGLAISKALVEAHRGQITATSPGPGRGSVFTFVIPAPDSDPAL